MPADDDSNQGLLKRYSSRGEETPLERRRRRKAQGEERAVFQWLRQCVGDEAATCAVGELMPKERPIRGLVEDFLGGIRQDEALLLEKLSKAWTDLLGQETSRHLTPVAVENDTLLIAVDNNTYLYVFPRTPLGDALQKRLRECTDGRIRSYRLVQQGRR